MKDLTHNTGFGRRASTRWAGRREINKSQVPQRGFTIVELLIVIVVIAVLATISIVAYNGVQQRARASAAQAGLTQAAKKLAAYKVENADLYPPDLATAGINNTDGVTYQYTVNNTANPPTFCITATAGNVSYKVTDSTTPASGGCAGHGVGGVAPMTNLAVDPRATTLSLAAGNQGWNAARWFGSGGGGSNSLVTGASDGPVGITTYARKTWSAAPSSISGSGDTGYQNFGSGAYTVSAGTTYAISCYLRPSVNRNFNISVYQYNPDGTAFAPSRSHGPTIAGPANQWTRVSYVYTVPTGVGRMGIVCDSTSSTANGAVNWAVGSTLDGTALMVTEGSTLTGYADGNSTDWVWNGTANNSTSTGPAQ